MKSVCVFCGSSSGSDRVFAEAAIDLGTLLGKNEIELIYGGGNIGLMGEVADAALAAGGKVTGVIPHFLWEKEVGHKELTEMKFVDTMHERKQIMADLADGFIALPGGFGTLDELAEILTWAQLGLVSKPIGLLNVKDYFQPLRNLFDNMVKEGFLKEANVNMLLVDKSVQALIDIMTRYKPEAVPKWLDRNQI